MTDAGRLLPRAKAVHPEPVRFAAPPGTADALAHGPAAASSVIDADALIVGIHLVSPLPTGLSPWASAIGAAALVRDGLGAFPDPSPQKEDSCIPQGS